MSKPLKLMSIEYSPLSPFIQLISSRFYPCYFIILAKHLPVKSDPKLFTEKSNSRKF